MPVYNEGSTVKSVVNDLLSRNFDSFEFELIIVESNSVDSSREIVASYLTHPSVRLILEDSARGKGHAVRRGLSEVRGEIVLIQDADLEYQIDDYPALIEPIIRRETDLVLGNRGHHGGSIRVMPGEPWSSRLTNIGHYFFTFVFNFTYRQKLQDPFTMYKVFRTECIDGLKFTADRFDFDWELLAKICRRGYVPLEVPVTYHARGFNSGKKVRLIRDPIGWILAAVRFRFCRLD